MSNDPFGLRFEEKTQAEMEIDIDSYAAAQSQLVYDAIQSAATGTERDRASRNRQVGISDLGFDKEHFRLKLLDEPITRDTAKVAAWVGTVLGADLERQLAEDHPDWIFQETVHFPLPEEIGGGNVKGHPDIIIPPTAGDDHQAVIDLKTKAELETIRRYGPSQQQRFQRMAYAKACVEAGLLDPSEPILVGNVFFDRSGRDVVPHADFELYSEAKVWEIYDWLSDVIYAVKHGERCQRDVSEEFCVNYCEIYPACLVESEDRSGLITEKEVVDSVKLYAEGAELEKQGKRLKDLARDNLSGVQGSTGEHTIKQVHVAESVVPEYTRKAYTRTDIRKVPQRKAKK